MLSLIMLAALALFILLAFFRATVISWLLAVMVIVPVVAIQAQLSEEVLQVVYVLLASCMGLFGIPRLRSLFVSRFVLNRFQKSPPNIIEPTLTENGVLGWEADLFIGHPQWGELLGLPVCGLSEREQAFLDKEVEQLCAMLNDWDKPDLSPEIWTFMKEHGFFGINLTEEYSGLGFSAQAHSAVISKIASRSGTTAVMATNAVYPLLLRHGTKAQQSQYLRRLARGQEVMCLAVPGDAVGVVCRGEFAGKKKTLGVRLNWNINDVALAPVATLLALAFKLQDPEGLLEAKTDCGVALIPADTSRVQIGRHHLLLNEAGLSGSTAGRDVFIPLQYLLGGIEQQGESLWAECLSAGRLISWPAATLGGMKLAARSSGAYCRVQHQPDGQLDEGMLARIGANTYMVDALCRFSAQSQDLGQTSAVVSAITKYHATERGRVAINDAMDLHGSRGICLGPANYLARLYQQQPAAIAGDGANISLRTRMIAGQGAVRSHPYALKEIAAARETNQALALQQFDDALFGHAGFVLSNMARSFVFGLFGARGIPVPSGEVSHRYYQQLTRFSAAFALSADVALLGGSVKHRELQSARLGDVSSQLYLCSATLKRYADEGSHAADAPLLHWAMQDALFKIQTAFVDLIQNIPNVLMRIMLHTLIFPIGRNFTPPSDKLARAASALLLQPGASRDRLTGGIYLPAAEQESLVILEAALVSATACDDLRMRKTELMTGLNIAEARELGIISLDEVVLLKHDEVLRSKVLNVDDFAPEA
jgi:acyl-CoA dehydrogenase